MADGAEPVCATLATEIKVGISAPLSAAFARALKGDEKGAAQTFLIEFFRALGHENAASDGAAVNAMRQKSHPDRAQQGILGTFLLVNHRSSL